MARRARPGELNDQQQLFCREYMKDLNGRQAAIRAGYSEKTAQEQASDLLSKPKVQQFCQELMNKRSKRVEIEADLVLVELAALATVDITQAYDDMGQLKPLSEIPPLVRKAISGLDVNELFDGQGDQKTAIGLAKKIKFWDKTKALELLGKHLKLFTDKVEHTGKDGEPIQFSDHEAAAKLAAILNAAKARKESNES